jgi:hypothetical protein
MTSLTGRARLSSIWENGFLRAAELARERHAPVVLAIFPLFLESGWRNETTDRLHCQIRGAGDAAGFRVIDLLDDHPVAELIKTPGDIYHANPEGLRLASDRLVPVVREVLKGGPPVKAPLPARPPSS